MKRCVSVGERCEQRTAATIRHARGQADGKERKSLSRVHDHLSISLLVTQRTLEKEENIQTYTIRKKRKRKKRFKMIKLNFSVTKKKFFFSEVLAILLNA